MNFRNSQEQGHDSHQDVYIIHLDSNEAMKLVQ